MMIASPHFAAGVAKCQYSNQLGTTTIGGGFVLGSLRICFCRGNRPVKGMKRWIIFEWNNDVILGN